jgi:predicted TIM-barrel fold metal-dependent hydrolase
MSWDSHVHCFEPDRFPYSSSRTYTPRKAPLHALLQNLLTDNFMLVQASIENGHDGLLAHLNDCHRGVNGYSGLVRGTVLADSAAPLLTTSDDELFRMHNLGVRCIRLHGLYGGSGHNAIWTQDQFEVLARSKPVQTHGWSISAQLPLRTWSHLKNAILNGTEFANTRIVADHNACAVPSDYDSAAMQDFLDLLRSGRVYVKVCALYRRSPGNIQAMRPIISLFAQTAPQCLLWGSDWPHVNTSYSEPEAGPLKAARPDAELAMVKTWLSAEQIHQMLVENPNRLFGN